MQIVEGLAMWQSIRCPHCNIEPQINEKPEIVSALQHRTAD
jgi:hypothetical protein